MGLKGEGLGVLRGKKKKNYVLRILLFLFLRFFIFLFSLFLILFFGVKNFLYRFVFDNLIILVIFRVNGSVVMIIDFFFFLVEC